MVRPSATGGPATAPENARVTLGETGVNTMLPVFVIVSAVPLVTLSGAVMVTVVNGEPGRGRITCGSRLGVDSCRSQPPPWRYFSADFKSGATASRQGKGSLNCK